MGTTLQGKKIKDTFKSIIKVTDNGEAGSTGKQLTDGNGNDLGIYVDTDGVFGIGSAASVSIDASSKTDAIHIPNGTTAQRPTSGNGMMRFNTTTSKFEFYDGAWKNVFTESGGTIDGDVTVTGDLTVQGASTTISSQTVTFEDNILLINKADAADTPFNTTSAGIEIEKAGTNPSFIHTFSDSTWTLSDNLRVGSDILVTGNIKNATGGGNDYIDIDDGDLSFYADGKRMQWLSSGDFRIYETDGGNQGFSVNSSGIQATASLYVNGNRQVLLSPNGNSYFNGGNLGVGIATPTTSYNKVLHINDPANTHAELHITAGVGQGANDGFSILHSGVNSLIYNRENGRMNFGTNNIERMRIHSGGDISFKNTANSDQFYWDASASRLGIGTTSPSSPLDIKSNSTSSAGSGITLTANGSDDAVFKVGEKGGNGSRLHMYDGGVEKIAFYTDGTDNHISAGNVGIGTTTPSEKLEVNGTILSTKVETGNIDMSNALPTIKMTDSDTGAYARIKASNGGLLLEADEGNDASGSNIRFEIDSDEKMRINSSGNVGIGETNPSAKIDIKSTTAGEAALKINYSSGNAFQFQNGIANVTTDALLLKDSTNDIDYITLRGGNVGINQINPTSTLDVDGTIAFGSLKDTAEDITITKFVDEADTIASNKNDTTIPTSAAVDAHIKTKRVDSYKVIGLGMDYMSRVSDDGGVVDGMEKVMRNTEKLILA